MGEKSVLFSVRNKHVADSGTPPSIDGDVPRRYHGYFENAYGEQFVFVFDRETQQGTLWAGDAGWERSFPIVDGDVSELVLNEAERLWLRACWLAAGGW